MLIFCNLLLIQPPPSLHLLYIILKKSAFCTFCLNPVAVSSVLQEGRAWRKQELGIRRTEWEFSVLSFLSKITPGKNAGAPAFKLGRNPVQLRLKHIHCRDYLLHLYSMLIWPTLRRFSQGWSKVHPWQKHYTITHLHFSQSSTTGH